MPTGTLEGRQEAPGQETTGKTEEVRDYYHRILPYYDAELADRGDGGFWTWAAGEPRPARVLELGCGTGRATVFLARSATRVVGFDLSPELVARARRKLGGERAGAKVDLFAADMRDLALRERFDLVTAVDDPFSHLIADEDRGRAFTAASRHLAPGGRFLLDAAWFSPQARRQAAGAEGLVREHSVRRPPGNDMGGGDLMVHQVWHCDPDSRVCSARFEYRLGDRRAAAASFPARLWSLGELTRRAHDAGLVVAHLWGDYDRRPWARLTSSRMIAELWPRDRARG
ncbi:MAG TPA: class I SAM-dependent methyltransferase [Thermoanaerobaculia bacterium]|jgi:SAM-dependent methyltransferase|nr:class I SAM-dependent methyltransferase [Thermoanaerobaculia bacterium]